MEDHHGDNDENSKDVDGDPSEADDSPHPAQGDDGASPKEREALWVENKVEELQDQI